MKNFNIHTVESAPKGSKAVLENAQKQFGMIPNLLGVLAEAPGTLNAYVTLHELFASSSFNADEVTVIWQTINVEHACNYCVPAHTGIAQAMSINPELTQALRDNNPMPTKKLQVLQDTTLSMVRNRGHIAEKEVVTFYQAGYNQRQLLEIVLGLSQKVISNYAVHLTKVPIDEVYKEFIW